MRAAKHLVYLAVRHQGWGRGRRGQRQSLKSDRVSAAGSVPSQHWEGVGVGRTRGLDGAAKVFEALTVLVEVKVWAFEYSLGLAVCWFQIGVYPFC